MTRRVGALLIAVAVLALLAPLAAPYDPESQHRRFLYAPPMPPRIVHDASLHLPFVYPLTLADRLRQQYEEDRRRPQPLPWFATEDSSPVFLLGSDALGRDVLSRVLHGARISVSLAFLAIAGALVLGIGLGGVAGVRGGWIDDAVMRFADFIMVLPVIYIVLVLRAALPLVLAPWTIFALMAGIFALVGCPFVARGVRNIVTSEREREYVVAARAMGASTAAIFRRHLLPACGEYLLVQATILLPAFILAEATLSYVGLGFPEHVATWGTMLDAAEVNTITRFPWTLAPALAIFLVVFSTNLLLQSGKIDSQASGVSPS